MTSSIHVGTYECEGKYTHQTTSDAFLVLESFLPLFQIDFSVQFSI